MHKCESSSTHAGVVQAQHGFLADEVARLTAENAALRNDAAGVAALWHTVGHELYYGDGHSVQISTVQAATRIAEAHNAAIRVAVATEREACAKIADEWATELGFVTRADAIDLCADIAEAIRARAP